MSLRYRDKMYRVAVDLDHVLEVQRQDVQGCIELFNPKRNEYHNLKMFLSYKMDQAEMSVTVEPSVTIGFLNRLLVSKGFTLPVGRKLSLFLDYVQLSRESHLSCR